MPHGRLANNMINKLHERCLRIIYSNVYVSYKELLEKGESVSRHRRNLRIYAKEMFKVVKDISPEMMTERFHLVPGAISF